MQINSTNYHQRATILDYLDDDASDSTIESLLAKNTEQRMSALRQKLGLEDNSTGSDSSKIATATDNGITYLSELLSTDDDSTFAKAASSSDTSEITSKIQAWVTSYNSMVSSMSSRGTQNDITFLVNLGKIYVDNESSLNSIGITRSTNGQLTVDTEKLKSADIGSLKSVFNGENSYSEKIKTSTESIQKVSSAMSAMSNVYSQNYSSSASYTDGTSYLMDALFNSKA